MSRDSSGTAAGSRSRSRSAARGSRPETQRSAAKRRKLISAAHDAFQEKGFAATTIDDIIARAGGSRGTIYLYSGSKLALFETVVREEAERFSATLGQVLSDASNGSADPFAIVEQLFAAATGEEALGLLRTVVAERARFPEIGAIYREIMPGLQAEVQRVFDEYIPEGIGPLPPRAERNHEAGTSGHALDDDRKDPLILQKIRYYDEPEFVDLYENA